MFMVVPLKPLKLDFTYASNKPIKLFDDEVGTEVVNVDEENVDDVMEENDFQHDKFTLNEYDLRLHFSHWSQNLKSNPN